jgi:hypothetical protein
MVPVIVLALEHVIAERDVEVELAGIVGPEFAGLKLNHDTAC